MVLCTCVTPIWTCKPSAYYVNVRQMLRKSLRRFTLEVAMMPFVKFSQMGQTSGSQDRKDVQLDLSHLKEVT